MTTLEDDIIEKVLNINGIPINLSFNRHKYVTYKCKGCNVIKSVRSGLLKECRECKIDKQIKDSIESRGGTFIEYVFKPTTNNKTRKYIKFLCKNKHELIIVSHDIDHICRACDDLKIEKEMKEILETKGGTFISMYAKNSKRNIEFTCNKNHRCIKIPSQIRNGSWCKKCNESKYEAAVRAIFRFIFNRPFLPKYPKWLINPKTKKLLELDGYEPDMKLAFEYNGKQHYEFVKMYHKTTEKLDKRKYKDTVKILSCVHEKVTLIVIPFTVKYKDLYSYLIDVLDRKKIINKNNFPKNIDYNSVLKIHRKHEKLINQIEMFLKETGKTALSDLTKIIDKNSRVKVLCINDHIWEGECRSLLNNYCKKCILIQKIELFLTEKGCELISDKKEIINQSSNIKVLLKNGTVWSGQYKTIYKKKK